MLKRYVESASMNTNTVDDSSDYRTINNCHTPQLAATPRVKLVSTRGGNFSRMSCLLLSRLYMESTKTVVSCSIHGTINNCGAPQLAAPSSSTRSEHPTRMSSPLRLLSRLCCGGCIRDRLVRHEPDISQPDMPTTELNLAAQPNLYPAYGNSPCETMRM